MRSRRLSGRVLPHEADSFVFSDDVTINVINVAQTDLTGAPIADTTVYGTAGIDLIIGDEFDNLIFGGDDNDIIFGGAGNDEIYGEGGDDVLIGDIGEDILYGDYHEDALKPAEELDTRGNVMNASELDGDDIIVGGAGIDKIDSGEGQNVAGSGDLSSVILNTELDECTPSSTMMKMTCLCKSINNYPTKHESFFRLSFLGLN